MGLSRSITGDDVEGRAALEGGRVRVLRVELDRGAVAPAVVHALDRVTLNSRPRTFTVPVTRPVMSKCPPHAAPRPDPACCWSFVRAAFGLCAGSWMSNGSIIPIQSTWISVSSKPT
jgi:hypothetical protein